MDAALIAALSSGAGCLAIGAGATYALMRGTVTAWRARGDELKAALLKEEAARVADAKEHAEALAAAHARRLNDQQRWMDANKMLERETARLRGLLNDYATPESVRARLDDLGRMSASVSAPGAADDQGRQPVPDPRPPSMDIVTDLK